MKANSLGDNIFEIRPSGRGELTSAVKLFDALCQALGQGAKGVHLDLSEGSTLSGAGLIDLFRLGYFASSRGARLVASGLDSASRDTLTSLGLSKVLPLFSGRRNAMRALGFAEADSVEEPEQAPLCKGDFVQSPSRPVVMRELPQQSKGTNVKGRALQDPACGYGKLWLKQYSIRLPGVEEQGAKLSGWLKERLPALWPEGNDIAITEGGIAPGAVGAITLTMPGGVKLDMGLRVIQVGRSDFTFATLRGHLASGYINFSCNRVAGVPVLTIRSLARTGDPLFDIGFRLFGHIQQERFWQRTLLNAAEELGVVSRVESYKECVDTSKGAGGWSNITYNSGAGTVVSRLWSLVVGNGGK